MHLHDFTASQLWKLWREDKERVIEILAEEHPGLTAIMLVQGRLDGALTDQDLNAIANLLIDDRVERFRELNDSSLSNTE